MEYTQYAQLGFPGSNDLANMFHYQHDFNLEYCSARPVEETRALHPELMSFQQWLERNAPRIPRHNRLVGQIRQAFGALPLPQTSAVATPRDGTER
jgi:hypothetical protein